MSEQQETLTQKNPPMSDQEKASEITEGQTPLTDEQKRFINTNLPAVLAREASWLTPEEVLWIKQNATFEEKQEARQHPPGCPPIAELRAKFMGKRLIAEDGTSDENTFKRSDLGDNYRIGPGVVMRRDRETRRICVNVGPDNIAYNVFYG